MSAYFSPGIAALHLGLLTLLGLTALAILRSRSLFSITMLSGFYSLIVSVWFVAMSAVDVAFTEATVGAGISTSLILAALIMTPDGLHLKPAPWKMRRVLALIATGISGALLVYAGMDLPILGDPEAPAIAHLGSQFLHRTPEDIGIPNVVTAVLASYRGFDTFGETVVIFTAALAVIMLLPTPAQPTNPSPVQRQKDTENLIACTIVGLMIPLLFLYAFYVQFHGDYGPGGGFQAGVIFAVAVMLHTLTFGIKTTRARVPDRVWHGLAAFGVLLYGGVGLFGPALDANFLDYNILHPSPETDTHHSGQHLGIWLVELGVLATVAGSMISIFMALVAHHPNTQSGDAS